MRAAFVLARGLVLAPVLALGLASGCATPLRMCTAVGDCGARSSCVAGRCVAEGAVPAIATAHRLLYDPVAIGYVRRRDARGRAGDGAAHASPAVALLGRDGGRAFLRFSVPLTPEVKVFEAYVVVDRIAAVDADPVPLALHVARVVDPWDPRSLSWAVQPRVEEFGAPVTRVSSNAPVAISAVRLDVRALVEAWRTRRRDDDFGLAIVAEGESPTGVTFALAPLGSIGDGPDAVPIAAPRLELYVR